MCMSSSSTWCKEYKRHGLWKRWRVPRCVLICAFQDHSYTSSGATQHIRKRVLTRMHTHIHPPCIQMMAIPLHLAIYLAVHDIVCHKHTCPWNTHGLHSLSVVVSTTSSWKKASLTVNAVLQAAALTHCLGAVQVCTSLRRL